MPFFKVLKELTSEYDIWLDEMKKSQIAFEPFKGVVFDKIFDSIEGYKGKRGFLPGKDATEEKKSIETYKSEYAEYWKTIIGVDGDFDLKEEKVLDKLMQK